ncbi:hypothetical protein BC829DRAFT_443168 [Chytridium lagenaria]|nr:hypothetical protein BC829DRAFT_443168 [Chytridium lagenaria]
MSQTPPSTWFLSILTCELLLQFPSFSTAPTVWNLQTSQQRMVAFGFMDLGW